MSFVPDNNRLYRFSTGLDDDLFLDISQNPKTKNHAIIYKWNNGANQKFAIRAVGGGKYAIFCSADNQTLEVSKGSSENGAVIHASQPNKQQNELWEFIPCTDSKFSGKQAYYLKSFCGKSLDVFQGKAKKEQPVIQWDHNGGKNQVWVIEALH